MNDDFKTYLQKFLKREPYNIDPKGIDFDSISDFDSMLKQLEYCNVDSSRIKPYLKMIFVLYKKGIFLYDPDYKSTPMFSEIKYNWVTLNKNRHMSIENYIERFLLDIYELKDVYEAESIYVMGNPNELNDKECEYAALAEEIGKKLIPISNSDRSFDTEKFVNEMFRTPGFNIKKNDLPGYRAGLIGRLKKLLHFDIESFDQEKHKAEICKIIYFFYELKYKLIPEMLGKHSNYKLKKSGKPFDVIEFLSKPSMEGVDYSRWGQKTCYGDITRLIKNELEKQMNINEESRKELEKILNALEHVADTWNTLFHKVRTAVDSGKEAYFDQGFRILSSMLVWPTYDELRQYNYKNEKYKNNSAPTSKTNQMGDTSPIAALYLRICQIELLAELEDTMWANDIVDDISICSDFDMPTEFSDEMKLWKDTPVNIHDVEKYVLREIDSLKKILYPKEKPDPEDRRRVKANAWKVPIVLNCYMETMQYNNRESQVSKLLIVSCLQAILLDEKSHVDYTFYDCQNFINLRTTMHLKKKTSISLRP